jgi:hypothetical protein
MTKCTLLSRYSSPNEAKEALKGLILLYKDAGSWASTSSREMTQPSTHPRWRRDH